MINTLSTIIKDNWNWRKQIYRLAVFDLKKQSRGAVLGWCWFLVKPAMYLFCFWFALRIGLRHGQSASDAPPYILWLASGLIPWFFMQEMLNGGINVLRRYSYLVNKIKFPLSAISGIFTVAELIVHLMLVVALFLIYFLCGMPFDAYLIQLPVLIVVMVLFWNVFSIMFSQLSAISKDIANLMKALSTPLFWLSGVIFNIKDVPIPWIQTILQYNPITFFCSSYRMIFYDKMWIWQDLGTCFGFVTVFAIMIVLALVVYRLFNEEVADVF